MGGSVVAALFDVLQFQNILASMMGVFFGLFIGHFAWFVFGARASGGEDIFDFIVEILVNYFLSNGKDYISEDIKDDQDHQRSGDDGDIRILDNKSDNKRQAES